MKLKPGQACAQLTVPAGWVVMGGQLATEFGVESFEAMIAELQQDTDPARIRALLQRIPDRSKAERMMAAAALALGANLIVLIHEWLAEAPDDPQEARRTPRSTGNN